MIEDLAEDLPGSVTRELAYAVLGNRWFTMEEGAKLLLPHVPYRAALKVYRQKLLYRQREWDREQAKREAEGRDNGRTRRPRALSPQEAQLSGVYRMLLKTVHRMLSPERGPKLARKRLRKGTNVMEYRLLPAGNPAPHSD